MNKKAFSFVETIITVTILVLLATVGFSMAEKYNQNKTNTKVETDLATLTNAFTSYKEIEKKYPDPIANKNYFTVDGMYSHSGAEAFGVHGFITSETLPKKYLNFVPVDIKTNQYYAFGKTIDNTGFEIAGVLQKDGTYISKVYGNYSGETGPYNLIREYNGPSFVANESQINFPYNPDEKLLTAKIGVYSGSISLNGIPLLDDASVTSTILRQGDTLSVMQGAFAQIYYSDGSSSTLGDDASASTLTFSNMAFVGDSNIYTHIKLALQVGSLWTNAAQLDTQSSFEVYTTDTSAAVRGTVFGVTKNTSSNLSTITVEQGKVQIERLYIPAPVGGGSGDYFLGAIVAEDTDGVEIQSEMITGDFTGLVVDSVLGKSFLESTGSTVGVTIYGTNTIPGTDTNTYKENIKQRIRERIRLRHRVFRCDDGDECTREEFATERGETTVKNLICDEEGEIFLGGSCVEEELSIDDDYELVAYAPYNNYTILGDTSYTSFNNVYGLKKLDGFLTGTQATLIQTSNGACIPTLSSDYFLSGCSTFGTIGDINGGPLHGFGFNGYTHMMSNGTTKGVFIDNSGTDTYLKYNILGLTLGNNFAIEMNVRGAALKRISGKYYLFTLPGLYKGGLFLDNGIFKTFNSNISVNVTSDIGTINSNTFYKIIYIYNGENNKVKIKIGESDFREILLTQNGFSNDLYVGSTNTSMFQWNDIIDYVKIYKMD